METNIKQLKCGSCGEELHKLYQNENGEILIECNKCGNISIVSITQPTLRISNYKGLGCITTFD